MSCTSAQMVAVAATQVGYKEGSGNFQKYGAWYNFNGVAWCDIFVSWCAAQVGGADVVGRQSYCPTHILWFKGRNQWSTTPSVGGIIFFDWNGDGTSDHVGIVESISGSTIHTIEGNSPDGVYRRTRSGGQIMGYGHPAYSDVPGTGTDPGSWGGGYTGTPTTGYPFTWPPAVQNITLVSAETPVVAFHGAA